MRLFTVVFFLLLAFSCRDKVHSPGQPLMAFDFNDQVVNRGLLDVSVQGDAMVSYHYGKKDTSLDLMATARFRKPVAINFNQAFSLADYSGFTVSVWVQKASGDEEKYCILSQQQYQNEKLVGWELIARENGSWSWLFKDSIQSWSYSPTVLRQPINDDRWHQLAFSYDKYSQEARLYYDGVNVAVYSMFGNTLEIESIPLHIGISPSSPSESVDVFNGRIDDLAFWSRFLHHSEIQQVYSLRGRLNHKQPRAKDEIKIMTWDIWQGAMHEGKHVGAERILDVIETSGSDLVMLQEMAGIGPYLADGLGYYYYQRTRNLGLLSRFPLMESKNVYRPRNAACIKVNLGKGNAVFACPIALSQQPRMDSYLKSGDAVPDSIIAREMEGRGKEITFILGELRHLMKTSGNTPILLGGGFYSGSHLDWTEKNKDQNMGLVVDYPVSVQVERAGFKDAYRVVYPDETKSFGYTWSPKFESAYLNRTDFIYYFGEDIVPVESSVVDNHPVSFPSSHAAVTTVFEL